MRDSGQAADQQYDGEFIRFSADNRSVHWYPDIATFGADPHASELADGAYYDMAAHRLIPRFEEKRLVEFSLAETAAEEAVVLDRLAEFVTLRRDSLNRHVASNQGTIQLTSDAVDVLLQIDGATFDSAMNTLRQTPWSGAGKSSSTLVGPDKPGGGDGTNKRDPLHNLLCHGIWP